MKLDEMWLQVNGIAFGKENTSIKCSYRLSQEM